MFKYKAKIVYRSNWLYLKVIQIGNINFPENPLFLAPMEDVSDPPFRRLCKKQGADMVYTEFISSDGLIRDAEKSIKKLDIYEEERPVGIQIFGGEEEPMKRSAEIVEAANPNVLDINYGCPVKNVVCRNAGSGILQDIDRMMRLTEAIVKSTSLPVTVKTRLGWDAQSIRIVEIAERLQDIGVRALSVHCRTRHQMYSGKADWSWIGRIKENPRIHIPIIGNGDIQGPEDALELFNQYGADGVMIGRAAIGYPWIFREIKHFFASGSHLPMPSVDERVDTALEHLRHSIEWKGEKLGILEMRRHYSPYFRGLPNIRHYRNQLVRAESQHEVTDLLEEVRSTFLGSEIRFEKNTANGEYADY